MKHLRYYSEFKDVEGTVYRIELLQESEQPYTPQEVVLASQPVTIEWGEVTKLDPVAGSGATLRLVSMTDRQFVDLYTVELGAIRMDVYRNNEIYWSGTIDTELYEEPYSDKDRYITEITFSDFAMLERLTWERKGLMTLGEIINECISASQVSYVSLDKNISTTAQGVTDDLLDGCKLSCENFYDEDGEAWNMREVLDEVLRPFALRMKQKNGRIYIYDLNAFYTTEGRQIEWRGSNSTLGVEPTYNKAVVTFSPYSQPKLFDGVFDPEEIIPEPEDAGLGVTTLVVPLPGTDYGGFNAYISREYGADADVQGVILKPGAHLFRIDPINNGDESAGVAWGARGAMSSWVGNAPKMQTWADPYSGGILMETPRIPIRRGDSAYEIRIKLDLLCDVRTNPFEEASEDNNESEWKAFKEEVNFGMVPCSVYLYGVDGKTYVYTNEDLMAQSYDKKFFDVYTPLKGKWKEKDYTNNPLWLTYYDEGDRKDNTGLGGWQTNKQSIGGYTGKTIPKDITLNISGEKIPMPPVAGELQVRVYAGLWLAKDDIQHDVLEDRFTSLRWVLYRNLVVDVVSYSGADVEVEDIETTAWINKAARDELPLETYVGSATQRVPIARGAVISGEDSSVITRFTRGNYTDTLERLLIGTIYSQYATRKNSISGTIKLIPEETVLLNKIEVNSRYVVLSASEYLADARTETKIAEFTQDTYEGIEYE